MGLHDDSYTKNGAAIDMTETEREHARNVEANQRFILAARQAIREGGETFYIGTNKRAGTQHPRYTPAQPLPHSGCGSPAAMCAENKFQP